MKYLIINTSGKQFCFKPGEWQDIDFIKNASIGNFLFLNKILLYRKPEKMQLGKPFLQTKVLGKVIQECKGKKITVLKTKPKKKYTRVKGHRQLYTRIQIHGFE